MADVPVHTLQPTFARGEVSPYLFGRVDTSAYSSGLRTLRNMFVRPEGAVSNRQGFQYLSAALTNTSKASILIPIVFSATQSYVIEIGAGTAQVTSGGALVGGATFAIPWGTADLPALRWSQSSDTLTVVHGNYPPYEIKRTSANSFTCLKATYNNGPFLPQNTDGTTFVSASAVTGTVTLVASSPIFNANQVGGLLQLTQQDLSVIPPWEPAKKFTDAAGAPLNPVTTLTYRRASLKTYKCVAATTISAASYATGTWIPNHSQGTQPDGDGSSIPNLAVVCGESWQYQDSGFGVVLITGYIDTTHVTGIVQPNYTGGPGLLPQSVIGGPVAVFGPFTFTATANQTAFTPLTGATSTDPTKFFVTVNGIYQAPSLYSVAGTTLTFLAGQAVGATVVIKQISQLGQTTYWAFGAFSVDQGYPRAVTYFPDRLIFAATPQQPVGVFGSQTSQYHNFAVSNPVIASDAFSVFLNARQLNSISDLIPLSDLLVGTQNIIWRLWAGSTGTAIGPLALAATPQSYYGEAPNCAAILYGDSAIFPEYDGRRLRDLIYTFQFDKFVGQELTLYSRHLIPFGTQLIRLAYKPDPAGQMVFALRSDGVLLCCSYLREQQVIGWSHFDTQGTFEDICVVPENTTFALYALINRTINGVQVRSLERWTSREVNTIYDYQFLDSFLTYDGRNTSATTMTVTGGTTWLAGDTGTITASSLVGWAHFTSQDAALKNEIWITDATGNRCRLLITGFVSATQSTVRFKDPCPVDLQGISTSIWTYAKTSFTGATQLAGMTAVALVDANVFGMNATATVPNGLLTVSNVGAFTLPFAGGVVQIGLPYLSDFETLALNEQGQETIRERAKTNPVIYLDVLESRNFLAGTDFINVTPNQQRTFEPYTSPTALQAGILYTRVASELTSECHTCIRQNMPLPLTIRMHVPQVTIAEPVS